MNKCGSSSVGRARPCGKSLLGALRCEKYGWCEKNLVTGRVPLSAISGSLKL